MNIGESIKYWRTKRGLTQKQLAQAAQISEISIRKYEANSRMPKIETLSQIAKALGVSLGDLDEHYSYISKDRNVTSTLIKQLEQFIEKIPDMNISEETKASYASKASKIIENSEKLINMINKIIELDNEVAQKRIEYNLSKNEFENLEREIDEIFLEALHCLNFDGQEKAIAYTVDLAKIPEYRKGNE